MLFLALKIHDDLGCAYLEQRLTNTTSNSKNFVKVASRYPEMGTIRLHVTFRDPYSYIIRKVWLPFINYESPIVMYGI